MTVLTDYGLAAVGGALAVALWARAEGQVSRTLWAACFLAVAVAAVAGGTWHGWSPRLARPTAQNLWLLTYVFMALGNAFILSGSAWAAARAPLRAALTAAVVLRFVVWFALIAHEPDFRYVVYDYAGTLVGLLALAAWLGWRGRPGAGWIAGGVAVSLAGAVIQRARAAPSPGFNHNDLFHVIQAVGLYLYFQGGRRLEDADRRK